MPTALVTGGTGFIGSNLVKRLLTDGWRVRVYDNLSRVGAQYNLQWLRGLGGDLEIITGDIRDPIGVNSAVQGVDCVFHLAGQVAVTTSIAEPRTDFEINALGTINVLEAARQSDPSPAVVFASTNKVYGDLSRIPIAETPKRYRWDSETAAIGEEERLDPYAAYDCSKVAADQYMRYYARVHGVRAINLRLTATYGPRQYGTEEQGWVAYFCINAALDRPVRLYGYGKQVRDIVFVDDVVQAFVTAFEKSNESSGQAFNVGGGPENTLSILELFDILESRYGHRIEWSHAGWRPGDPMIYVSDTSKIRSEWGWTPTIGVEQGVDRICDWIDEHIAEIRTVQA